MNFNKLTFEEKFGQMIMIGLDVYELNDEIIDLIDKYKIGGVVLYRKNYISLETMIDFINKIKKINRHNSIPLFIAIDQENGSVNRLPKEILQMPGAYKQGKLENEKVPKAINELTTYILKNIGVNMNFAPVIDINHDEKNIFIGNRCYGDNKEKVIKHGMDFMYCMKKNDIISVIKHFPGHGATEKDSRFTLPLIEDIEKIKNNDLIPFEYAIKNNCDAIMVGHLRMKGYGIKPASINKKIIKEYLIDKLKYNGLIVTDDLRMGIMPYIYKIKKSIIKSIEANNDIVLIKYKKGDISRIYKDLFKMVKNYEIDIEKINNSAKKIVNIKKKYTINDDIVNPKLNVELINNKIKKINDIVNKELGV